jgi:hypothetical protein
MKWEVFSEDHRPLRDELIEGVSKVIQFEFPQDYVDCVKLHHGGQPEDGALTIQAGDSAWHIGFGSLLTLDPLESRENVINALATLRTVHGLPHGYLPIAIGGGGDYLCLDYSQTKASPKVVFWFHELEGADAIFPVADSFAELLAMLKPHTD